MNFGECRRWGSERSSKAVGSVSVSGVGVEEVVVAMGKVGSGVLVVLDESLSSSSP